MKAVIILVCVLFSLTLSGAVVRNNFQHHARSISLRSDGSSSSSSLVFSIDNSTATAQGTIQCQNSSEGAIVNVTIVVDEAYILTKFAIYINRVGAPRYITVDQYGYVENNATNGYSYSQCGLYTNVYHFAVNYSTLVNITSSGCFEADIALDFKKFCGSYTSIEAISQSPEGCDTEFEVLSPAPNSYVQILIDPNQTLDGYCVNPGLDIGANTPYMAQILSSYDPRVLNSTPGQYVGLPGNLELVNYLFNNQYRYYQGFANVSGAEECGWQDIQIAIWTLLDPARLNFTHHSIPQDTISQACVSNIVADATANGRGYVPPCPGGRYIVLVVPINRDCRTNCTRLPGVQITAFVQGGPCLTECNLTYCHYPQVRASANFSCSGECNPSASPVYPCVPRPSNSPVNYPCIPRPESPNPSPSSSQAPQYPCIPRPEPRD